MSTLLINTSQSTVTKSVDVLVPGSENLNTISLPNEDYQPKLAPSNFIDVVHNFSWYAGPKSSTSALDKVPCVFLTEREQKVSSLISGALYYLRATKKAITGQLEKFGAPDDPTSLLGKLNAIGAGGGPLSNLKSTVGKFGDAINKEMEQDTALLNAHNLKSLEGIYLTSKTGFNYRLPYYNQSQEITSEWGENDNAGGKLRGLIDAGTELVDTISQTVNITQPGVYIEKPKYFQNADAGITRTLKFPLLNTIRRSELNPVQQNYELLWLLTFQNKPYKTSFAKTPPPKIYTVSVPGEFSMPYAYISSMSINFLGTVRRLPVSIPTLSNGSISPRTVEVPIPEAYDVSISFTSLINDYGNTMVSDAFTTSIAGNTVIQGQQ
jgi:hypothetical protein